MAFYLREQKSDLALWSVRLSTLSIPILLIASIGHRSSMMNATETYSVMALGFSIAALGVIAAVAAFEGIWRDGRRGVRPAVLGIVLGLIILSVPAIGAWKIVAYPKLTDISTDTDDPPEFVAVLADRGPDDNPIVDSDDDDSELQREAYPDIVSRHYAVGPALAFDDAQAIVDRRGWTVLSAHRPDDADQTGRIEAVASTLLFGFRQDLAIRVEPDGEGSLVDMRSAVRNGTHDLGANAERIRSFFADLDAALQGISE